MDVKCLNNPCIHSCQIVSWRSPAGWKQPGVIGSDARRCSARQTTIMSERYSHFWAYLKKLGAKLPISPRAYTLRAFMPKVRTYLGKLQFLEDAIALFYCAIDPKTPKRAKAIAFAALAYFICPADVVPDWVPVIGMLDDAAVIGLALWALGACVKAKHRQQAKELLRRMATGKATSAKAGSVRRRTSRAHSNGSNGTTRRASRKRPRAPSSKVRSASASRKRRARSATKTVRPRKTRA